jgi:hypothetical protein
MLIAGEAPDASTWGPFRASDFLLIVQDVTSWALTNFEAFRARPAAEELPRGICGTGGPHFRKAPRLQPPYVFRWHCQNPIFGQRPCPSGRGALVAPCVTRRVAPLLQPNETRASVAAVESAAVAVPSRAALVFWTHEALAAGVRASAVEPTLYFYPANETTKLKVLSWKAKNLVLKDKRQAYFDPGFSLRRWRYRYPSY